MHVRGRGPSNEWEGGCHLRPPSSFGKVFPESCCCPPGLSRVVCELSSLGVIGGWCGCGIGDVGGGGVLAVVVGRVGGRPPFEEELGGGATSHIDPCCFLLPLLLLLLVVVGKGSRVCWVAPRGVIWWS